MLLPKIEIQHVYKIFHHNILDTVKESAFDPDNISPQDKIAVNNVSLEFNSGESLGIIGKNGAGKSTLLSIIAGLTKQTQGQLRIQGKVTAVMTLGIGLREDLSGRENIYLDGELQGKTRKEIDEVIDEIIAFSELKEFIDKPIKFYSTGMKSRLAFSMLVCIKPEILIIDEALSAGDVFFAEKATKKIREICSKGKIVIVVSHSMGSIRSLCNRCLWIDKGQIVQDGDPLSVTEAYLQKVQEEDHSIELAQFQKDISRTENWASYKIGSVAFRINHADFTQKVFHTEDYFTVEITIEKIQQTAAELVMSIERIDGVMIDLQTFDLSSPQFSSMSSHAILECTLDRLVLNKGFYQLKLELTENQRISNQRTTLFEVKNNKMATGGYSILHYPAQIEVLTEGMNSCLDSIEQTVD